MLLNTDLHNDALQQQQRRMSAQVPTKFRSWSVKFEGDEKVGFVADPKRMVNFCSMV
jgi:hypothetical protein